MLYKIPALKEKKKKSSHIYMKVIRNLAHLNHDALGIS